MLTNDVKTLIKKTKIKNFILKSHVFNFFKV